jgi:hypothetical protein
VWGRVRGPRPVSPSPPALMLTEPAGGCGRPMRRFSPFPPPAGRGLSRQS